MIILILYGNITIQLSNSKTTIHISGIIVYEEKYINIEYEMILLCFILKETLVLSMK
jgi:hypothetical protein